MVESIELITVCSLETKEELQLNECLQIIDTPSLDRVHKDENLKFLLKGVLASVDLIICAIDAFDCNIKDTKLSKVISQNKDKDFLFVVAKSDMLETDDEIKEQIDFIRKQINQILQEEGQDEEIFLPFSNEVDKCDRLKSEIIKEIGALLKDKLKDDIKATSQYSSAF